MMGEEKLLDRTVIGTSDRERYDQAVGRISSGDSRRTYWMDEWRRLKRLRDSWRQGKGLKEHDPTPYDQPIAAAWEAHLTETRALEGHTLQAATLLAGLVGENGLADSLTAMARRAGHLWAKDS